MSGDRTELRLQRNGLGERQCGVGERGVRKETERVWSSYEAANRLGISHHMGRMLNGEL